jgi:hypothetical protein
MDEGKTINIDGIEYLRSDSVETVQFVIGEGCGVASAAVGMNVIVRTQNEGVNAGTVVAADGTGVVLKNARRLWYHKPINGSWYEGVSKYGADSGTKVSCTVPLKFIVEDYSLTVFSSAEAFASVMDLPPHKEE